MGNFEGALSTISRVNSQIRTSMTTMSDNRLNARRILHGHAVDFGDIIRPKGFADKKARKVPVKVKCKLKLTQLNCMIYAHSLVQSTNIPYVNM